LSVVLAIHSEYCLIADSVHHPATRRLIMSSNCETASLVAFAKSVHYFWSLVSKKSKYESCLLQLRRL